MIKVSFEGENVQAILAEMFDFTNNITTEGSAAAESKTRKPRAAKKDKEDIGDKTPGTSFGGPVQANPVGGNEEAAFSNPFAGQAAQVPQQPTQAANPFDQASAQPMHVLTLQQFIEKINGYMNAHPKTVELRNYGMSLLNSFGVQSIDQLPATAYGEFWNRLTTSGL